MPSALSAPAVLAIALSLAPVVANAQAKKSADVDAAAAYPARPVRFIVPLAPGGGTDFVTRLFAQKLAEAWQQQVVVDNRPGASGIIASEIVAKANPDGHTLIMITGAHVVNPLLHDKLPYDTVKAFAAVSLVAHAPVILTANPAVAARSTQELVALAKAKPGQLSYASFGYGAVSHLAGEQFRHAAGIDLLHVPYKGAGEAIGHLLGGQVHLMFSAPASVLPHFKTSRLRGFALTGAKRARAAPDIPTFAEQGMPSVDITNWYAVLAPAGTPRAVVNKIRGELVRVVQQAEVLDRLLQQQSADPAGSTPEELQRFIESEIARWSKLVKESGLKLK